MYRFVGEPSLWTSTFHVKRTGGPLLFLPRHWVSGDCRCLKERRLSGARSGIGDLRCYAVGRARGVSREGVGMRHRSGAGIPKKRSSILNVSRETRALVRRWFCRGNSSAAIAETPTELLSSGARAGHRSVISRKSERVGAVFRDRVGVRHRSSHGRPTPSSSMPDVSRETRAQVHRWFYLGNGSAEIADALTE